MLKNGRNKTQLFFSFGTCGETLFGELKVATDSNVKYSKQYPHLVIEFKITRFNLHNFALFIVKTH